MTTLAEIRDPKELRPLLHRRLDDATDEELSAVHRVLLEMEARRLADDLGNDMQEAWDSGKITQASIAESVLEHRRRHPYK